MRKLLVLAAAVLLLAASGAAMNKGELIDRIADDARISEADAKRALATVDTVLDGADRFSSTQERTRTNDRKTVQPRDLIILASGHGDEVSSVARDMDIHGGSQGHAAVREDATGHGDDVRVLAIDIDNAANEVAREGRNPQTGEEIQIPARTVGD